ncbi:MAG: TetR family transcriptional regulator [Chitinivibrionales bacterium]|nr:TetR family transcriptional regulator [Chitinivibrionales bacterium]MBD3396772.1 TetR family transcriptional regulator [Chitinivibrionales bacterium]
MQNPRSIREKTVRDAKAGLILDAALQVFSQKGFHDARLEDIAAAAGFSKASLYNYYEDKDAMFLSLAVREYQRVADRLEKLPVGEGTFEENIKATLSMIFSVFGEHFSFLLTLSNFRMMNILSLGKLEGHHEQRLEDLHQSFFLVEEHFRKLVATARDKGETQSELSDDVLAGFLGSMIRGVLFDWKLKGTMGDAEEETRRVLVFLKKGMDFAQRS